MGRPISRKWRLEAISHLIVVDKCIRPIGRSKFRIGFLAIAYERGMLDFMVN